MLYARLRERLIDRRSKITDGVFLHCFGENAEDNNIPVRYESRVGLIARTGAGKTSLLLSLLGESKDDTTKHIIRYFGGNNNPTKVGTAIPTMYSLHDKEAIDITWYSRDRHREYYDLTEKNVAKALLDIREQVEKLQLYKTKELSVYDKLVVRLPKNMFIKTDDKDIAVNVIDLPGLDSYLQSEHKYTLQVYDYYYSSCSAVILVVQDTAIASLFEDVGVTDEGWSFGSKARGTHWTQRSKDVLIVVTHNIIPEDLKSESDYSKITKSAIVNGIYKEIIAEATKHEEYITVIRDILGPDQVFPIELGDTARQRMKSNVELSEVLRPIICELQNDLRSKILGFSSEYQGIKRIRYRLESLTKIKEKRAEDLRIEARSREASIANLEHKQGMLRKKILDYESYIKNYKNAQRKLNKLRNHLVAFLESPNKLTVALEQLDSEEYTIMNDADYCSEVELIVRRTLCSIISDKLYDINFESDRTFLIDIAEQYSGASDYLQKPSLFRRKQKRRMDMIARYVNAVLDELIGAISTQLSDTSNMLKDCKRKMSKRQSLLKVQEEYLSVNKEMIREIEKQYVSAFHEHESTVASITNFKRDVRTISSRILRSSSLSNTSAEPQNLFILEDFYYRILEISKVETWLEAE